MLHVADTGIGAKLLSIIQDSTEDLRARNIAIEGVCNLLYSFSPYRTVNSLWAIRNLLWDSSYTEKADVMSSLGWGRLSGYFTNPNELIKEKAMAILDNLAWREPDLQFIFDRLGEETLCVALENAVSSSNADLVEQVSPRTALFDVAILTLIGLENIHDDVLFGYRTSDHLAHSKQAITWFERMSSTSQCRSPARGWPLRLTVGKGHPAATSRAPRAWN
ncbi:hypothetical protein SISNIDRAFT_11994 [Sistotremastrum niveocremeum HHB9708]|uniref:ARM repeat-containing protein n=1 Tax=Sistotremastrum niveocremeum HHB9708 TaxID=1314777 RepID=A0A165AJH4_9AGAM|nr:hypothetical protein SISNIDRAFT_11994 [Sistotremastrum niveocremeum HHB9708]